MDYEVDEAKIRVNFWFLKCVTLVYLFASSHEVSSKPAEGEISFARFDSALYYSIGFSWYLLVISDLSDAYDTVTYFEGQEKWIFSKQPLSAREEKKKRKKIGRLSFQFTLDNIPLEIISYARNSLSISENADNNFILPNIFLIN